MPIAQPTSLSPTQEVPQTQQRDADHRRRSWMDRLRGRCSN
jgi:hypothetical protein